MMPYVGAYASPASGSTGELLQGWLNTDLVHFDEASAAKLDDQVVTGIQRSKV